MKPPEVVDREEEWSALEAMWERDGPQLVIATGRRRIGKSYILTRFARQVGGL